MLSNNIRLRKIGMMFLIFSLVFTGLGASLGTPVSYAASSEVYVASGGNDSTGDGTKENPYKTLNKAYQEVDNGGTIYVKDDITLPPPFDMNAAKKFTITTDPEADKPAVIHRGSKSSGSKTLFGLNSGHLTLKNIVIDGGSELVDGRIFNIGSSKLTIEKDTILRNNYDTIGGSAIILLNQTSVLEMNGGKITGNMHANSSAVLINIAGARFTMTGGEITGNSGGGVQVKAGEFDLSGNAVITGNTFGESERNVYLEGSKNITLSGDFTGQAGITAQNRMIPGKQFGQANSRDLKGIENLVADSGGLLASYGENNTLVWKTTPGGVKGSNVSLWLKADDGVTAGGDGTLPGWKDQIGKNSFSIVGTAPTYQSDGVNFNPVVNFGKNGYLRGDTEINMTEAYTVAAWNGDKGTDRGAILSPIVQTGISHQAMYFFFSYQSKFYTGIFPLSDAQNSAGKYMEAGPPENGEYGLWNAARDKEGSIYRKNGSPALTNSVPGLENPMIGVPQIGRRSDNTTPSYLNGNVAEIIVLNKKATPEERNKVESYLALKYGITLNDGKSNYYDAAGNQVWVADANYTKNIAGIGRDDAGSLYQKQSRSINTGDQVAIGIGELAETNALNTNLLTDKQYLIWGDNGKGLVFDQQIGNVNHAQRVWKVQNTGAVGQVQVAIPTSAIPAGKKLLVSNSEADFNSAKGYELAIKDLNGVEYYVATVSDGLTNGQFFTYGVEAPKVKTATLEEVTTGGKEITLTFDQEIELTDLTGLTVKIGAKELSINDFEIGTDGKTLILKTTEDIKSDDIVEVSYLASKGNIKGTNGAPVQDFTKVVENKLTPATPLAAPSNVKVTGDQLTWDAVENAGSYEVSITDSKGNVTPVSVPSGTTLDLSTLEPPLTPGEYTLTVTAKSNNPAYTDSQESGAVTYTVPTTPATPLAVPSNVKVTGDQLTWDAVENAGSYEVSITDSKGNVTPVSVPSGTELDLSTLEPPLAPGEYTLTVTAKSNNPAYTDSQESGAVTYTVPTTPATPLAVPSNVKVTGDQLTWDAVENAGSYEVNITDSEGKIRPVTVPSGTELDLSTLEPPLGPGEYTLTVTAKSNDPAYTDSQASESVPYTVQNGSGEVNKTKLQAEVDRSKGLTETDYTQESWANLELALAKADSVLKNPNATQADVDQALAELQKALKDLVVLNGELEKLNLVGLTNNGNPDIKLTPAFDPNQYKNYSGTVTNDVYGITLNTVAKYPDDTQVKVIVNGTEYPADKWNNLPLIEGKNVITVGVYDKGGNLINEYTITIVREKASGNDNSGGGNTGGGSSDGGNSGTGNTTPPPTTDPVKPGNIITTDNGSNVSFASGTVNGDQATVTIDKDKLSSILADGKGHKLGISVPGKGDVEVRGLTLEGLKKIADTGSSLEIEDVLAIYPVPAGQLDVDAISKQFGNAPLSDIAANIKIKRSADDLAKLAREKAAQGGYELLVHPVDLDLSFMHGGKTDRAGLLNGYAPKYIALPEGIDPNRITTGVIVNPDGSVFHVPTVVTKVNNRYFALINDLRSSGTYSVIWNPQDFEDVQYHWGRADVNNIAARLDLKGNGDNTFSPNRYVTRSEFAEIVVLGLGLMRQDAPQNIYPDVPASAWYRNAVALADEFDIVRGYEDGNFKGGQQITREQGFAMIARAYRLIQSVNVPNQEQIASTLAPYADGDKVASWAKADVAQLIAAGIIQGNGPEHLSPKAGMTRAEVTALMARMLKVTNLIDK